MVKSTNPLIEGQTINLNIAVYGPESNEDENNKKKNHNKKNAKKHKRKPGGGIRNETAKCWKYFDLKMEQPDGPDRPWIKMAHHLTSMYDDGKHFHIRCMAHILNLVVKAGLKVQKKEVETIGLAVKYIKKSSQRIEKFKASTKKTCDSNRFLIAECPRRWNSTYDMLKSAIDLEEAFHNYSMNNASFSRDLKAIPRRPLAHLLYSEILDVDKHLREWEVVSKFDLMVSKMRLKYDKHLMENDCIPKENEDEENTPIAFLTDSKKEDKIKDLVYEVETKMGVLFALYNEKYGTKLTHDSSDVKKSSSAQSSNTTRLHEPPLELDDEKDFDILLWWKLNSPRFPIVLKMGKDILSIQISTIAFDSAFSTSGRVLDPYRNALSPQVVEALIRTQSRVRTLQKSIYMDDLEDLLKDEDVIKEMQKALDKLKGDNRNGKGGGGGGMVGATGLRDWVWVWGGGRGGYVMDGGHEAEGCGSGCRDGGHGGGCMVAGARVGAAVRGGSVVWAAGLRE
nr:hypothetical protein [Tanacetum cinerariifolium]